MTSLRQRCYLHWCRGGSLVSYLPRHTLQLAPQCPFNARPLATAAKSVVSKDDLTLARNMRNLAILAHVDFGKTTVTERIGELNMVGEVHHGDTVMDYLDQERERGITINSAATSFEWRNNIINLIDTPGHVDFTLEVERSVRALDGAITIFDGVSGVQAQSETVWKQLERYGVPRIGFVNKMDRAGADMFRAVRMIEKKLKGIPLITQLPHDSEPFDSIIDVVEVKLMKWDRSKTSKSYEVSDITEPETLERCLKYRAKLAEQLATYDEELEDLLLELMEESESNFASKELLSPETLKKSIANVLRKPPPPEGTLIPLLCGSALKNVGVQPLLDSAIAYLPSPDTHELFAQDAETRALVFKIQQDVHRGPLAFVRVYSGELKEKERYFNVTFTRDKGSKVKIGQSERAMILLRAYANEYDSITRIGPGDIGVVSGFKHVRTGDTLTSSKKLLPLPGVRIPSPVFSASIELETASDEKALSEALEIMQRDDPSLSVVYDTETDQVVLYGMGELHLDIAQTKLNCDFGIECTLGRVRVAYREAFIEECKAEGAFRGIPGDETSDPVHVVLRVWPNEEVGIDAPLTIVNGSKLTFKSPDKSDTEGFVLRKDQAEELTNGVMNGLERGPILGYPMQGINVEIVASECIASPTTAPPKLRAAAALAVRALYEKAEVALLEPVASLELSVHDDHIGAIIADLAGNRRGSVEDVLSEVGEEGTRSTVFATVPLEGMIGYSTTLRSMTSGDVGQFSMKVKGFVPLPSNEREKVIAQH